MATNPLTINTEDSVAVVTGGANGIGKGIVKALLTGGASVVIADIEEDVVNATVKELSPLGPVDSFITDVADEASVEDLSTYVFNTHGKCNFLFNNAGVGSGGGGKAWQNEPNDWKWCFSVNVFGQLTESFLLYQKCLNLENPDMSLIRHRAMEVSPQYPWHQCTHRVKRP